MDFTLTSTAEGDIDIGCKCLHMMLVILRALWHVQRLPDVWRSVGKLRSLPGRLHGPVSLKLLMIALHMIALHTCELPNCRHLEVVIRNYIAIRELTSSPILCRTIALTE